MTKKILSMALAIAMVMALSVTAFAQTAALEPADADGASITVSNASKGVTYAVYKLFDATVTGNNGGSIAYQGDIPETLAAYFEKDTADNVLLKEEADAEALFEALSAWAKTATATKSVVSDGSVLTFTDLPYGYYVVTTTQGDAAITVSSTNPNATVIDKNSTVAIGDLEKLVKDNETDGFEELAEVAIGDTVTYQVTFTTSNYAVYEVEVEGVKSTVSKQIQKYTVSDTLPNFLEKVTITSVTVDGTAITTPTFTNNAFDIVWAEKGQNLYNNGAKVVVTYTATITENVAVGGTDNKNTVTVKWTDEDDKTAELSDTANVHSYKMNLTKVDENNTKLDGAKFKLYDAATEGTEIKVVKVSDGVYRVAKTGETGVEIEAGEVVVNGLDADVNYYLEETVAPAGYNKLTARQAVTLVTTGEETTTIADADVTVENKKGTELPSTGGIGTTIFYALGAVMVIGAGVLLVAKKRMSIEG